MIEMNGLFDNVVALQIQEEEEELIAVTPYCINLA